MPPSTPLVALLLMLSAGAHAQPRPDPLEARAPVPPIVRKTPAPPPPDDPPPTDWRKANERVAHVGGWRTYAREQLPEVAR